MSRSPVKESGAGHDSGNESDDMEAIHLAPLGSQHRGGTQRFGTQRISSQRRLTTQANEEDEEEEEEEEEKEEEGHQQQRTEVENGKENEPEVVVVDEEREAVPPETEPRATAPEHTEPAAPTPTLRRSSRAAARASSAARSTTPATNQTPRRGRGRPPKNAPKEDKLPKLPPSRVYVEIPRYPFKFRTRIKPPPEIPEEDETSQPNPPPASSYMNHVELPDADSDIEYTGESRPVTPAATSKLAIDGSPALRLSKPSSKRSSHPPADTRTSHPPTSRDRLPSQASSFRGGMAGKKKRKQHRTESESESDDTRRRSLSKKRSMTKSRRKHDSDSSDDSRGKHRRKDDRRHGKKNSKRRDDSESDSDDGWNVHARKRPKNKSHRADPDDEANARADTEDEDVAAEIKLDEPDRFKTDTRLRAPKQSKFLAGLKKLNKQRVAQRWRPEGESVDREEDDSEDDDDEDESSDDGKAGSDNFIVSDDDLSGDIALPEEFSLKRESPEYKFKVVFQYLVLLVVKGARILPLKGEDDAYFGRQLRDVRKLMRGLRDSMAGSVWRPEFREALETYPIWKEAKLDEMETFCDACNRRNQRCFKYAWLRGSPYDKQTHEDKRDSDESDSDESDGSDDDLRDLGDMGNVCLKRARDFHELTHWEHTMYLRVRRRYHCLLRAKKKQATTSGSRGHYRQPSYDSLATNSSDSEGEITDKVRARRESARLVEDILTNGRRLPQDVYDVDQVTEWMDACGWQKEGMRWLRGVEARARTLEGHL